MIRDAFYMFQVNQKQICEVYFCSDYVFIRSEMRRETILFLRKLHMDITCSGQRNQASNVRSSTNEATV